MYIVFFFLQSAVGRFFMLVCTTIEPYTEVCSISSGGPNQSEKNQNISELDISSSRDPAGQIFST